MPDRPLRLAPEISIRNAGTDAHGSPLAELVREGDGPTGATIAGAFLEAAVAGPFGFLLFLTNDVPFEEWLNIHLTDESLAPLDHATLGGAYSTGSWSDLRFREDAVTFRFIDEVRWVVRVSDEPRFVMPLIGGPKGVQFTGGPWHRLDISREPL